MTKSIITYIERIELRNPGDIGMYMESITHLMAAR